MISNEKIQRLVLYTRFTPKAYSNGFYHVALEEMKIKLRRPNCIKKYAGYLLIVGVLKDNYSRASYNVHRGLFVSSMS